MTWFGTIERCWFAGQSLAVGPGGGTQPPECPVAAVRMWLRKGDTIDYDAFGDLEQPSGYPMGPEIQCGVNLWKQGIPTIQINISRGATFIGSWGPGPPEGTYYPRVAEDVPEILAASEAAFPGAIFHDRIIFICGQSEAASASETFALQQAADIQNVIDGYQTLIGHPFSSIHIALTQSGMAGGTWVNTVRAQQLSVPGMRAIYYDDLPTTDGVHPDAANTCMLGARVMTSVRGAITVTISHDTAIRTAIADLVVDSVDAGPGAGKIVIREGATTLATVILADPAFGGAVAGVAALLGVPLSIASSASGTANNFQCQDSTGAVKFAGSVTATGGGGDLTLDTVTIVAPQVVTITGGGYTAPP